MTDVMRERDVAQDDNDHWPVGGEGDATVVGDIDTVRGLLVSAEPRRWVFSGDSITHGRPTPLGGATTPNCSANAFGGSCAGCVTS